MPEVLFRVGVLSIGMRGVKDAEPGFPGRIQRLERLLAAPCVDRLHCAVDETGRSLTNAVQISVLHEISPFLT